MCSNCVCKYILCIPLVACAVGQWIYWKKMLKMENEERQQIELEDLHI